MSQDGVGLYLLSNMMDRCQLGSKALRQLPEGGVDGYLLFCSLLDFRAMGRMFGGDDAGRISRLLQAAMCLLLCDRQR